MPRRRSVAHTFEENLLIHRAKLEAQVAKLKPGPRREALLEKIRLLDVAVYMNDALRAPGLEPQN